MQSLLKTHQKITPKQTGTGPYLGCGVQIREKFQFLIALGVFGPQANLHTVCQAMYVTSSFKQPKLNKKTDEEEQVEIVNDATAYTRIENICRTGPKSKSLIQEELDFLKRCFTHLFGDNAMAGISSEFLLNGTLFQILKSLNGSSLELDWANIDPVVALEALSYWSSPVLEIEIESSTGTRWTKQKGGITPALPEERIDTFPTNSAYKLFIDADIVREKPIVFEFLDAGEGRSEDGRPARAQIMHHVVRSEEGEGPWRVSEEYNQPLEMGDKPGRFGFCVVAGIGRALSEIFPSGFDPYCLSNDDLRDFARHVLEQASMASPPLVGIQRFHLATPDAIETQPKRTDPRMGSGRR